jgi:hypothetical protein
MPETHECFYGAHQHMTIGEYGFYSLCRSLSQDGVLQFNGHALAAQFSAMSKNTPYERARALEMSGWFVRLPTKAKRPGGIRATRQYKVLTYEEWAEKHPAKCV